MKLAPIVLFTYNRLWHTQQTIKALQKNELANESELFIYSDGAKSEEGIKKINEVRGYIKSIDGFKNIKIIERDKNWGLADNIIDGVTDIVNKYGKIIVLEDDLVTSRYFLKFMNDALDFYENKNEVWHISGWTYPIESKDLQETFLWRVMNCWGWATWKNRWIYYKKDTKELLRTFSKEDIYRFNLDGIYDFWSQVIANDEERINTWAIYWYATIFKKQGLCLNPATPLLRNTGFTKDGTHTKKTHPIVEHAIGNISKFVPAINIVESDKYLNAIKIYINSLDDKARHKRFSDEDYLKLQLTSRFQEIEIGFYNHIIKVPDAASLLSLNHELFGREIYKFKSEKHEPVVIDCGANIGLSIIFFKKLFPKARVIAFEPDKKIFEYLEFNVKSFQFDNVELINKGLWEKETTLKFFSEGADAGRIAQENDKNIVEIQTVKLSNYLKKTEIDFLKIDIEGAETEVLIESQEWLKNVRNIFIEYHSFSTQKQTLSTILNILETNGFRYYIEHVCLKSKEPFVSIVDHIGFDNQLHIFGYKK
jgi:FkbM family methyltransferase